MELDLSNEDGMMAQNNELMLRLLLKGKIVGRKYLCKLSEAKTLVSIKEYNEFIFAFRYRPSDIVVIHCKTGGIWTFIDDIQFDSFEQGIKVGEDWWFAGDRIEYEIYNDNGYYKNRGTITYKEGKILAIWDNGQEVFLFNLILQKLKHLGSIHDEPEEE